MRVKFGEGSFELRPNLRSIWLVLSVSFIMALFGHVEGQTPQSEPRGKPRTINEQDDVIRISTKLVQIDVIVTDQKGNHVTDLSADDFQIEVDGKSYPTSFFRSVAHSPGKSVEGQESSPADATQAAPTRNLRVEDIRRTIAFVIDDGALEFDSFVRVKESLHKFIREQMEEGDLVAIIRTDQSSHSLGRFTVDRRLLSSTVDKLKWRPSLSSLRELPGISDEAANSAESYSTLGRLGTLNHVARALRELPGRKLAILLSDGFQIFAGGSDGGLILDRMHKVLDEAHRGGVAFYTIDARGLDIEMPGSGPIKFTGLPAGQMPRPDAYRSMADRRFALREGLIYLARESGGLAVLNNNSIPLGIGKALGDNRSYYLLGFDPEEEIFNGKFRSLKVKLRKKGLTARTRSGFLGKADIAPSAGPKTRNEEITTAIFSPLASRDIPLELTAVFFTNAERQPLVRALIHFDCGSLNLQSVEGGKRATSLELIGLTFDETGSVVDQQERHFTLTLDPSAVSRALKSGVIYQADFTLKKPGTYQFRALLRETSSGKLGTASQLIEIPDLSKGRLALSGLFLTGASGESGVVRQFATSAELSYGAIVYSPTFLPARGGYQLASRIEIFKEGKVIHQSESRPLATPAGDAVSEVDVGGRLQLTGLDPGDYYLRLIVTDLFAPGKPAVVDQWMDFVIRP